MRRRGALCRRRVARRRRHHGGRRGTGGRRAARRIARSVGRERQRLGQRLEDLAVCARRLPRGLRALRQDGRPANRWSASGASPRRTRWFRRFGAAFWISSAPPALRSPIRSCRNKIECRRHRRHPGMHRLQRVRDGRLHHDSDPLHPEPHHGRGMAQGLAPGARSAPLRRRFLFDRRRGPGRPRVRAAARTARLCGAPGRGRTSSSADA